MENQFLNAEFLYNKSNHDAKASFFEEKNYYA